jgi:hypothetical protein
VQGVQAAVGQEAAGSQSSHLPERRRRHQGHVSGYPGSVKELEVHPSLVVKYSVDRLRDQQRVQIPFLSSNFGNLAIIFTHHGCHFQQYQQVLRLEFHGSGSLFAIRELRICMV